MKLKTIITAALLMVCGTIAMAQSAAVKGVSKSVFTLTAYDAEGSEQGRCHGLFIDNKGSGVTRWSVLQGAARATVTDATGKSYEVQSITGSSSIYDMVLIQVDGQTQGATLSRNKEADGSKVWVVGDAKSGTAGTTVTRSEVFMDRYNYYVLGTAVSAEMVACPVVNDKGQVLGLIEEGVGGRNSRATDVCFARDLSVDGIAVNDPQYADMDIPLTLPKDREQALLAMMLTSEHGNAAKYAKIARQFTQRFPNVTEGYSAQAYYLLQQKDYDGAANMMQQAIAKVNKKDEAHFEYAKMIYQFLVYKAENPYPAWSMDLAMSEAKKANEIYPLPMYKHLQAQIKYAQQQYQEAYDDFIGLTKTPMLNPELYYEAAQCKVQMKANDDEVLQLMDKAVETCKRPLGGESAVYFLARGEQLQHMGEYRKAVADYNVYDTLVAGRGTHDFYYKRARAEEQAHMYKQALNDYAHAIVITGDPLYMAEMAALQLKLNMGEDALRTAELIVARQPEYDEGYLLRGMAKIVLKRKAEGIADLQKAQELGNDQAPKLIETYK
ncbi:MAG: hypothetical protein II562_04155 [Prevotella sp.]|nr:hypothetical protein [Prevotella sp.]